MKKGKLFKRGCGCFVFAIVGVVSILWGGTRNLSDTNGSVIVERAEACSKPNNDFTYSTNPSINRSASIRKR